MVSYDGTWHKRGYTFNFGVGVVSSVDTGEILDIKVASKVCEVYQKWSSVDERSEEYEKWQCDHVASGLCQANYTGSSPAMESNLAHISFRLVYFTFLQLHAQ